MSTKARKALTSYLPELDLTWAEKCVAHELAWKADEHGVLIISHAKLAKLLSATEAAVKHVMRGLRAKGVVEAVANADGGAPGTAPWWRLTLPSQSGDLTDTIRRVQRKGGRVPDAVYRPQRGSKTDPVGRGEGVGSSRGGGRFINGDGDEN